MPQTKNVSTYVDFICVFRTKFGILHPTFAVQVAQQKTRRVTQPFAFAVWVTLSQLQL